MFLWRSVSARLRGRAWLATEVRSGLFMALLNILPSWIVLLGRDIIRSLGGDEMPNALDAAPMRPAESIRR